MSKTIKTVESPMVFVYKEYDNETFGIGIKTTVSGVSDLDHFVAMIKSCSNGILLATEVNLEETRKALHALNDRLEEIAEGVGNDHANK